MGGWPSSGGMLSWSSRGRLGGQTEPIAPVQMEGDAGPRHAGLSSGAAGQVAAAITSAG
jgi:hypothetical protein